MNCKPRILVVEDEPDVTTIVKHLLTRLNCETVLARTGLEGIEHARHNEFSLVILDIDLPDSNGFDVHAWLKQDYRFERTPFIFISGNDREPYHLRAFSLAADFIPKPFDLDHFVQRISSLLKIAPA